jgi:hypothetical protein
MSCGEKDDSKSDDKDATTDTATNTGTGTDDDASDDDADDDAGADKASFKVQLNNSSAALALTTATSLTAKLGGVDLIADCAGDAPPGNCLELGRAPDPDIWVNGGCSDDIAQCTTANTEFFELIDPTAANTVLNSQGRSIEAGVFTKVRIYFLNNDAGDALQCDGVASATRPAVPITVDLPEAITVAAGESVTVTLNYDPSAVDCADETTISAAISGITATVTKS